MKKSVHAVAGFSCAVAHIAGMHLESFTLPWAKICAAVQVPPLVISEFHAAAGTFLRRDSYYFLVEFSANVFSPDFILNCWIY